MEQQLISVIIPIYNAEKHLRTCLDSIVNQTYRNLEILLIDDGSPDDCGTICGEYEARDPRIRVIHQEHRGTAAARNTGLSVAQGEWIACVDADDWVEADMMEYLLSLAQTHHADLVQCGLFFDESQTSTRLYTQERDVVLSGPAAAFSVQDWNMISNSACNKLYRTTAVRDLRFDSRFPIGEDLLFLFHALLRPLNCVFGTQAKYHYVQHTNSVCRSKPEYDTLTSFRRMLLHASQMFDAEAAQEYFQVSVFRNDLDICSKLIRFDLTEYTDLKCEIQANLQHQATTIRKTKWLSRKEKAKLLLIARAWPIYRFMLLCKTKGKRGNFRNAETVLS